jgi:hypothetical protein
MNTLAQSGVFWVGLIAGLVLIYFLPTMIGTIRKVESLGLLIFLNVLPTGVGWFYCDGNGVHAAPPRAAANLRRLPVPSPVSAGS